VRGPEQALLRILPEGAVAAEIDEAVGADEDLVERLYAEELAAIEGAGERRRREFAGGRECARRALALLGHEPCAVPMGEDGAPVWPPGVVGSITHKGSYRAAALARDRELPGLGIDAEPNEPLPAGVLQRIATPQELDAVELLLAERPGTAWDRLLFSAKEATVKALRPVGVAVGLRGNVIEMDAGAYAYTATLTASREAAVVSGAWLARDGLLVAVAWPLRR
jgi:4'-phosphopantetheinyl transferase EntD